MSLKQRLTDDMKAAMKGGDKGSLGVIRLVNAAIKQKEVDERIELDDAAVLAVLEKMVKQRKDSVSQYEGAGREDLAAIERAEIVVIERYLPAKLDEAAIAAVIEAAIASTGANGIKIWIAWLEQTTAKAAVSITSSRYLRLLRRYAMV